MLVDMTLPRPIPAGTALRMVRKIVTTLMYLRGQMGSTWDQLEILMMQERMRMEAEEQQDENYQHSCQNNHSQDNDEGDDFVIPTRSLKEFLETGQRMFVDLEESIFAQLLSDLRQRTTSTLGRQGHRYISLALIFGTTPTTPKEQYMIRIGPLEPQQYTIPPIPTTTTSTEHIIRHQTVELRSPEETQRRSREEKKWERGMLQELMGLHITTLSTVPDIQDENEDENSRHTDLLDSTALRNRTRVHLLMKAPAGQIFMGMLPQQQLILHEDYPTPSATVTTTTMVDPLLHGGGGRNGIKKRAKWPIHHLHMFGPSSAATVVEEDLDGQEQQQQQDDEDEDEMWYLIGPGIPILSPLL
ncbi:hypothetical protein BGX29_011797 [Mortierella sp. GBA35]|nr:hypothetical protein BGX29_011797 [Mortierella sp. GBA35]